MTTDDERVEAVAKAVHELVCYENVANGGCDHTPTPWDDIMAREAIRAYESARGDVKPEWEDVFREIERAVEDGQKIADTTDAILALLNGGADRD